MNGKASHWARIARHWHLVGAPLRPGRADVDLFEAAILARAATLDRPMRALILGVTPELAKLDWPRGTVVNALDASVEMVEALWCGEKEAGIVGSWTAAPLDDASQDVIVCDGGVGVLRYPQTQLALLAEVRRLLAPGGLFAVRLFVPGCRSETVADIAADMEAGAIPSLDVLKFRLWGALQEDVASGVRPREVVATIDRLAGGLDRLASRFGWQPEHVATLEFHRGSDAVYCLSSVNDLRHLVDTLPGLELVDVHYPAHAYGKRCPVVSLRRSSA